MSADQETIENFNGMARLFPLPGLVLYPQAIQPLHIFEQRYRQMTADALASDRLIALTMLQPGWEENYDQRPAIYPVCCLGQIVADQLLPDGRYNLILRGLARVRILDEPPTEKLYRLANVEVLLDAATESIEELMELRTVLADTILPRISSNRLREHLAEFFHGELLLGQLCDTLAFALPLPPEVRQELLEEVVVTARARRLAEAFRAIVAGATSSKQFPPKFSSN